MKQRAPTYTNALRGAREKFDQRCLSLLDSVEVVQACFHIGFDLLGSAR